MTQKVVWPPVAASGHDDAGNPTEAHPQYTTEVYRHAIKAAIIAACPSCGDTGPHHIGAGSGPHAARLACTACGRWLRWLPRVIANELTQEVAR